MDKTPVYTESFQYAYQHREETQHIASIPPTSAAKKRLNRPLLTTIATTVSIQRRRFRMWLKRFGYDRMLYVLANTVQDMEQEWARVPCQQGLGEDDPVAFESGRRDVSY